MSTKTRRSKLESTEEPKVCSHIQHQKVTVNPDSGILSATRIPRSLSIKRRHNTINQTHAHPAHTFPILCPEERRRHLPAMQSVVRAGHDGISGKLKAAVLKLFVSCGPGVRLGQDSIDSDSLQNFLSSEVRQKDNQCQVGARVKRRPNVKCSFISFVSP